MIFTTVAQRADRIELRYWPGDPDGPQSSKFGLDAIQPFVTESGQDGQTSYVAAPLTTEVVDAIRSLPPNYTYGRICPFWDLTLVRDGKVLLKSQDCGEDVLLCLEPEWLQELERLGLARDEFQPQP